MTLARPKAGLPNWNVEVNADVGSEHLAPVRIIARSSGTVRLTGAGIAAMLSTLSTYYASGKAATILANIRDGSLAIQVSRDTIICDVLAADKETVVGNLQTNLLTAANCQVG